MNTAPCLAAALFALAGCSDCPRDPDGTLKRVEAAGVIRLGVVSGAAREPAADAAVEHLAARTGARVMRVPGQGEELLEALEDGKLDLVYGHFSDDSPWAAKVHFSAPPAGPDTPPKSQRAARFAFKAGENGWITAVEDAAP